MMKMFLRWAVMLVMCLMLGSAAAEAMPDFDAMLPLVDLTASAALRVGETPENITPDSTLSEAFVYNFFFLGQTADPVLGITSDMLADTAMQSAYLSRAFSVAQPELSGILAFEETYDYIGMQIMASSMNDAGDEITLYGELYMADGPMAAMTEEAYLQAAWLSHRAVVSLHKDADAPGGWKIDTFTFEPAIVLEEAGAGSLEETMAEYVNADLGFSLQYPAVFTEDVLQEDAGGVQAKLADGTASFFARRVANTQGETLESRVEAIRQQNADATAVINDISLTGRVTSQQADGHTRVDLVIVTVNWIYEAQLCYDAVWAESFALYSDYMTNSFMADEMGLG